MMHCHAGEIIPEGGVITGDRNAVAGDVASSVTDEQVVRLHAYHTIGDMISRGALVLYIHGFRRWVIRCFGEKEGVVAHLFKMLSRVGSYLSVVVAKSTIDSDTPLGPDVYISKKGNVIVGATRIGGGCVIQHDVTIGMDIISSEKPTIGDEVWIGAGSIVYGGITVGRGATIREGAILTKSVPPDCVVMGNPARVTQRDFDNKMLRAQPEQPSKLVLGD